MGSNLFSRSTLIRYRGCFQYKGPLKEAKQNKRAFPENQRQGLAFSLGNNAMGSIKKEHMT